VCDKSFMCVVYSSHQDITLYKKYNVHKTIDSDNKKRFIKMI